MSPEKQRIAIAEACGWKRVKHPFCEWVSPKGVTAPGMIIPDYLGDLNAMHEAEKMLGSPLLSHMHGHLVDIADCYPWEATATQRAEAFLRAIGKWEESA